MKHTLYRRLWVFVMVKKRKKNDKESVNARNYLSKVHGNPIDYAIIPNATVAYLFGKSQSWANKYIKEGVFNVLEIVGDDNKRIQKGITLSSVLKYQEKLDKEMTEVRNILIDSAKKERTIRYADLMSKVGMKSDVPYDRRKIGEILGRISRKSLDEYDVMLSALAVLKTTGMPNDYFYELAEDVEYEAYFEDEDDDVFWKKEIKKIYRLVKKRNFN